VGAARRSIRGVTTAAKALWSGDVRAVIEENHLLKRQLDVSAVLALRHAAACTNGLSQAAYGSGGIAT
jgi:hypothetical protein